MRLALLSDGPPLVALPGNPYAGLVAVLTLLAPLLAGMTGRPLDRPPTARYGGEAGSTTRIVPVRRAPDGVEAVGSGRPGTLWAAARADAFAVVPPHHRAGDPVDLLTL